MNLNKCNKLFRFGVLFSAFFTALVLIVFCPRLSATAYAESSTPEPPSPLTLSPITPMAAAGGATGPARLILSPPKSMSRRKARPIRSLIPSLPTAPTPSTAGTQNPTAQAPGIPLIRNMSVPAIWTSTLSGSAPFLRPPLNLLPHRNLPRNRLLRPQLLRHQPQLPNP